MFTRSSGTIVAGKRKGARKGRATRAGLRKQGSKQRLVPGHRPDTGVGEWLAAMVLGLDALEFLERSRRSLPD